MNWLDNDTPPENFAGLAHEWCALIDGRSNCELAEFLVEAWRLLSRLYAVAIDLPEVEDTEEDTEAPLEYLGTLIEADFDKLAWSQGKAVPPNRAHLSMPHGEWLELHQDLTKRFGSADKHWVVKEPIAPEPELSAEFFADDLIEIYRDVRHGLRLWQRGDYPSREEAARFWGMSFQLHWGPHALGAMQGLHALATPSPDEREDLDGAV